MIKEVIHLIEVIQEVDTIDTMIDMIEEIDTIEIDQDHLIIILEDIEEEIIQDQDIQEIDNHLKDVLSVVEMDILLKFVGIFKNTWRNW